MRSVDPKGHGLRLPPRPRLPHFARLLSRPLDLLGGLAAVVYGLPSLLYPFAKDQPIHWYIGVGMLRGEVPYVTGLSTKPPAAFVVHAASIAIFGDHAWSIRVIDLLFVLGCAALVATFRIREPWAGGGVYIHPPPRDGAFGAAAVVTSGIHYTFFDWSATAHPELWEGFFMLAATWLVARAPGGRVSAQRALAAGALACTAVMFKHVAAIHGFIVGVAATTLALRWVGPRRALAVAGSFTGGVLAILLLTVLPFVLLGHFDAFYEAMVDYILKYAGKAPAVRGIPPFFRLDSGGPLLLVVLSSLAAGVAVALRTRARRGGEQAWLIVVAVLSAFATVAIQRRALASAVFTYQYIVCTPFFALAIVWGMRQAAPRAGWAPLLMSVALVGAFFLAAPAWPESRPTWSYDREWPSFARYVRGRQTREEHLRPYGIAARIDRYDTQELVGLAIRERARPGDSLCVEGFATAIYAVAKLRCPSRHFAEVTAYEGPTEWRSEHRRTLRETPPTFLVTFADRRARIRELERSGYTRVTVEGAPLFALFHRAAPATPHPEGSLPAARRTSEAGERLAR